MTDIVRFLREYDGPPVRLMEVCGTHTAEISHSGIPRMLSKRIQLISGPGCPVCVTVTDYIDKLVELSKAPHTVVASFGDLLRVPGSRESLSSAKGEGARVQMLYSPMELLSLAKEHPDTRYVFAAVGFETTAPAYALLLSRALEQGIDNLQILTSLKVMPPVIDWVCRQGGNLDGFLAPGHVSVVTGSRIFEPLSERWQIPFVVAGFEPQQLIEAIYALVRRRGKAGVWNLYPSAVTREGNVQAQQMVQKFFEPCSAAWRGMGLLPDSGLMLREEYARFDAGSRGLDQDHERNPACRCAQVLMGKISPHGCPLFGRACTPQNPQGACMVSAEGSCFQYLTNHREDWI